MQANAPLVKKPNIDVRNSRFHALYDTAFIVQNTSEYNLFPSNASKVSYRNNYVTNPLPGNKPTSVIGISVDSTLQVIPTAANIDPVKIINALKNASIEITADQNEKQMIRGQLSDFFNFTTPEFAMAGGVGTSDAVFKDVAVHLRSKGNVRLAEPFVIGAGQNFNVKIVFADSSVFPTAAHWTTAALGGSLGLVVKLHTSSAKD